MVLLANHTGERSGAYQIQVDSDKNLEYIMSLVKQAIL